MGARVASRTIISAWSKCYSQGCPAAGPGDRRAASGRALPQHQLVWPRHQLPVGRAAGAARGPQFHWAGPACPLVAQPGLHAPLRRAPPASFAAATPSHSGFLTVGIKRQVVCLLTLPPPAARRRHAHTTLLPSAFSVWDRLEMVKQKAWATTIVAVKSTGSRTTKRQSRPALSWSRRPETRARAMPRTCDRIQYSRREANSPSSSAPLPPLLPGQAQKKRREAPRCPVQQAAPSPTDPISNQRVSQGVCSSNQRVSLLKDRNALIHR